MTEKEVNQVIDSNEIWPDELDKNKYFGFFPAVIITLAFGIPLLPCITYKTTFSPLINWLGFVIGFLLILWTFVSFKIEKKIKFITTNLDKQSNQLIIENYFKKQHVSLIKHSNYYLTFLPTLFYQKGLKLIIIPSNNKIVFNIRTVEFTAVRGRIPFSIGKTMQQNKIFKNLSKQINKPN